MDKKTWDLLHRLVFDSAKTLQDGRHSTSDDWYLLAEDLNRAADLAQREGNRLVDIEEGKQ